MPIRKLVRLWLFHAAASLLLVILFLGAGVRGSFALCVAAAALYTLNFWLMLTVSKDIERWRDGKPEVLKKDNHNVQ